MKKFISLALLSMFVSAPVAAEDSSFSIPGVPGQDYPTFTEVPDTDFDCKQQGLPGYYVDPGAQCQVFALCQQDGTTSRYLCPVGTLFNQQYFVCDWWFNVECAQSP